MATTKVTFTLDEEVVDRIEDAAKRMHKPKSQVVSEAVRQYCGPSEKLSESERLRMLRVLKEIASQPITRSQEEVEAEVEEIRRARRTAYPRAWERNRE